MVIQLILKCFGTLLTSDTSVGAVSNIVSVGGDIFCFGKRIGDDNCLTFFKKDDGLSISILESNYKLYSDVWQPEFYLFNVKQDKVGMIAARVVLGTEKLKAGIFTYETLVDRFSNATGILNGVAKTRGKEGQTIKVIIPESEEI